MKVLFIEPPKDIWFVMGEYLPPPYGIIQLAAYLERKDKEVQIQVLDCNAEKIDWKELKNRIQAYNPDIVASSALATCNTYLVIRTLQIVKSLNPGILTVTGGQHFTALAQESLERYPEIDVIVRGEGEQTLTELVTSARNKSIDRSKTQANQPLTLIKKISALKKPRKRLSYLRRTTFLHRLCS